MSLKYHVYIPRVQNQNWVCQYFPMTLLEQVLLLRGGGCPQDLLFHAIFSFSGDPHFKPFFSLIHSRYPTFENLGSTYLWTKNIWVPPLVLALAIQMLILSGGHVIPQRKVNMMWLNFHMNLILEIKYCLPYIHASLKTTNKLIIETDDTKSMLPPWVTTIGTKIWIILPDFCIWTK